MGSNDLIVQRVRSFLEDYPDAEVDFKRDRVTAFSLDRCDLLRAFSGGVIIPLPIEPKMNDATATVVDGLVAAHNRHALQQRQPVA